MSCPTFAAVTFTAVIITVIAIVVSFSVITFVLISYYIHCHLLPLQPLRQKFNKLCLLHFAVEKFTAVTLAVKQIVFVTFCSCVEMAKAGDHSGVILSHSQSAEVGGKLVI